MKFSTFYGTLLAGLVLLASCSLDYEQSRSTEELSENIPNSIVRNYNYVNIRPAYSSLRIHAEEARMFHKSRKTELQNLYFRQIGRDGEVLTVGRAERAVIYTANDNVDLFGAIYFTDSTSDTIIEAEFLHWNNQERSLEGTPDQEVRVHREDGSSIRGRGFRAHPPSRTLEFQSRVKGRFVDE
ncbi:MAG TPA: LPS export ABC transporter periplasmic protein LptC [Sediminispirochaeta sp.]|nr:LPS export ABC transporter periplasmic protein LptC [Sediminispirochaeta sp.]